MTLSMAAINANLRPQMDPINGGVAINGQNPTDLQMITDKFRQKSFSNKDWKVDVREGGAVHIESKATNWLGQPLTVLDYTDRGKLLKNGKLVAEVSDRIQISLPSSDPIAGENTVISIDARGLDGSANGYANKVAITAGATGFLVNGVGKGSDSDLGIESFTHRDGEALERNMGLGAVQVLLTGEADSKHGSLSVISPTKGLLTLGQSVFNLAHAAKVSELNTLATREASEGVPVAKKPDILNEGRNKVVFDNENYEISVQKRQTSLDKVNPEGARGGGSLMVHNKKTGENYEVWGDPHLSWDNKQLNLFQNTQFTLDDGTVIVAEMEKGTAKPHIDKVTIVDGKGQTGVRIENVSPKNRDNMVVTENRQDNGYRLLQDMKVRMELEEADGKAKRGFEVKGARDVYGNQLMNPLSQGYINDANLGPDRAVNFTPASQATVPATASPVSFVRTNDDAPAENQWTMQAMFFRFMQMLTKGPFSGASAWGPSGNGFDGRIF